MTKYVSKRDASRTAEAFQVQEIIASKAGDWSMFPEWVGKFFEDNPPTFTKDSVSFTHGESGHTIGSDLFMIQQYQNGEPGGVAFITDRSLNLKYQQEGVIK